ncbi:MAG TPA: FtsX-like permease family protein [Vicinamibacterales bacterium]|nr:FtsX-like permease family protein [Vicinamibacterales bacterium]
MDLPFELFVALRYLLAKRKQAFISLISLISAVGVMVGVMAVLIALALMTGLQGELRDRLVGSAAHVYVLKAGGLKDPQKEVERLLAVPRVVGAAPIVQGKALLQADTGEQGFVELKGIVPEQERTVTQIERAMVLGKLDALNTAPDKPPGIILGKDLATQLHVSAGDRIRVFTTEGTLTPFGPMFRPRTFEVVGTFSLGLLEYDSGYAFVRLDVAQRVLGKNEPDFIELRVDDMFAAQRVADSITAQFGAEYLAQDWADLNKSLFSALWLEKMAISITIGLIVMVAALNIAATLVLLVMEKNRDIAILKTMGTSAKSIRRIFVLQGLVIGAIGTSAGAVFGYAVIYVLDRYKLIHVPIDVYQISYVPFILQPLDFAIVVLAALAICLVATIYPSRQASKLDPAQALRYQ